YISSGIIMSMPGVNPCSAAGYVTLPITIRGCGTTFSESGVNPCLSVAYTWMFLFGVTSAHSVSVSPFAAVAVLVEGMTAICWKEDLGRRLCENTRASSKARIPLIVIDSRQSLVVSRGSSPRFPAKNPRLTRLTTDDYRPLVVSYSVLRPPPSAAPTSAPFFPPTNAPIPAAVAVEPPTTSAVFFQSRRGALATVRTAVVRLATGVRSTTAPVRTGRAATGLPTAAVPKDGLPYGYVTCISFEQGTALAGTPNAAGDP